VGKVCNLCKVKTDISVVLTVMSGLDTHMIIKLKGDLNLCSLFVHLLIYVVDYLSLMLCFRVGIYLHLVNAGLMKLDQLELLIAVKPCQLFLGYSLACHIIYSIC
jgi:hypothetical protein